MRKRMFRAVLSEVADFSGDRLARLKYLIVHAFTAIGVSFVFIIGAFNLIRGYYPLGVLEITGGILCIFNVLYLRRTKNIEFAGSVILFLMLCLFFSLLVFGREDKTGLFWFFTFPLLALFLKGTRRGLVWIAFEYLIALGMVALSELRFLISIPYTFYEIVLLCMSLAAVTLIVFFYEALKNEFIVVHKKRQEERLQRKILDDQVALAERIQRLLIPQGDRYFGRLAVSGYYQAAAGVGGDYYDFFEIDRDRVAVIVCDVSGKGISGAFVMVNIRSVFQQHACLSDMNPAAMVKIINRKLLADSTNDIFAVLSVYVWNAGRHEVEFCHAGYGPFAYYSKKQGRVVEVPSNSLPAGVVEDDSAYVNRTVALAPGDIILSYTDGLLENFAPGSERSEKEALYRLVAERAAESPASIKQAIVGAAVGGSGVREQRDDVTLVVAKLLA